MNAGSGTITEHVVHPQGKESLLSHHSGSLLLRKYAGAAAALIPHDRPVQFSDSRGKGLPAVYDALLSRNLGAFVAIRERLKALFPTVANLEPWNPSRSTKAIGVRLTDDTIVRADLMSEGMLYFLAFAALPYSSAVAGAGRRRIAVSLSVRFG